jgi:hypothetical protein
LDGGNAMKEYEIKEVVKKQEVLKKITCDNCDKDITETEMDYFYEVSTSHHKWGNDSIESFKEYDFCSYNCMLEHLFDYFKNAQETYKYEIEIVRK